MFNTYQEKKSVSVSLLNWREYASKGKVRMITWCEIYGGEDIHNVREWTAETQHQKRQTNHHVRLSFLSAQLLNSDLIV